MPLPLAVFYCYPRSGGTLLNQCLLCAETTVVLSEVNPAASFLAVESQAQEWFGLVSATEKPKLAAKTYLEKIALLARRCEDRGRRLCLRDWSAVNFIPNLTPTAPVASGVLEQRIYLRSAGHPLREIVFLRRSREIFDSLRRHIPGFDSYPLSRFALHYRNFLRAVADCPRFFLEDFTAAPEPALRAICGALELEFPARFQSEFHRQTNVTGNTTLQVKPPSALSRRIAPAAKSKSNPGKSARTGNATFAALDALAGYGEARKP